MELERDAQLDLDPRMLGGRGGREEGKQRGEAVVVRFVRRSRDEGKKSKKAVFFTGEIVAAVFNVRRVGPAPCVARPCQL